MKNQTIELKQIRTLLILLLVLHLSVFSFLLLWRNQQGESVLTTPVADSSSFDPGKQINSIEYEGVERSYQIYIPRVWRKSPAMPVVVSLHGGGNSSSGQMFLTGMNKLAAKKKFVVVYPDAVNGNWNDGRDYSKEQSGNADDVGFIRAVIEEVSQEVNIDKSRIFATGMSNGAMMSHRLGCEASDIFAAIAPVAGPVTPLVESSCEPESSISVLDIQGDADPLVPYEGGEIRYGWGPVASADATMNRWKTVLECGDAITDELPDNDTSDGTTTTRFNYENCKDGVTLSHLRVRGGGHTWPGGVQYAPERLIGKTARDFSATEYIWEFFESVS